MMGNFREWVWISVFLGIREFLYFAEEVGLEQGCSHPAHHSHPYWVPC